MTGQTAIPHPEHVGGRAAEIYAAIQSHGAWQRLRSATMRHASCRATFTGYPTVSRWSADRDAGPLVVEAVRVLALKAAVFELAGGDAGRAELPCPAPVEAMVDAVLAQPTVLCRMQRDLGLVLPHGTGPERFEYLRGDLTDTYYAAARWGEQPPRYWLDAAEVDRRRDILNSRYQFAGLGRDGRSHDIDFASPARAPGRGGSR